ncbi:MAG: 50S ribosomal protein L11 methyltransferase [bacterium]
MTFELWIFSAIAATLFVVAFVFVSLNVAFIFGVPWVRTSRRVSREMYKLADLRPGQTVLDLGCGDGSLLVVAVKDFGASEAVGYEINPFLVLYGRIYARLAGVSDKVKIRHGNMVKVPLEQVDLVALYLLPEVMGKIQTRLTQYLSNDTVVVSRGFRFNAEPRKVKEVDRNHFYLYKVGDLID